MNKLNSNSVLGNFARLAVLFVVVTVVVSTAASSALAAGGINRYVSPSGSNTTDCASAAAPCQTITYALSQSDPNNGDTLLLDVGIYMENLFIDRNIRIVQNPAKNCPQNGSLNYVPCAVIDGGHAGRVVSIAANTLTVSLEKLEIRNGYISDDGLYFSGAGILNNGTLIIDDVTLHDNSISLTDFRYRGGAIDNQNSLTIRSSTIYNNSAYDGGGITSTGSLTMQNTEIYNNSAERFGGGIYVPYRDSSTIENSTLWGNSAGSTGGGVYISAIGDLSAAYSFKNVTISGNSAVGFGGGLVSYLQVTMDHCTLAENSAAGNGADLYMGETQTDSMISNTIVSNPAATDPICWFENTGTFKLSDGGNLSSDDSCEFSVTIDLVNTNPDLMALADNGGRVRTRALSGGSPAIDYAGPYALGADARGVFPQDGDLNGSVIADIGAFEFLPIYIYLPVIVR